MSWDSNPHNIAKEGNKGDDSWVEVNLRESRVERPISRK